MFLFWRDTSLADIHIHATSHLSMSLTGDSPHSLTPSLERRKTSNESKVRSYFLILLRKYIQSTWPLVLEFWSHSSKQLSEYVIEPPPNKCSVLWVWSLWWLNSFLTCCAYFSFSSWRVTIPGYLNFSSDLVPSRLRSSFLFIQCFCYPLLFLTIAT